MNCSKCGTYNNPQSKFCVKCGNSLSSNVSPQQINAGQSSDLQQVYQQPIMNNNIQYTQPVSVDSVSFNYFMYLIVILLKPFQCFKEEENKLNNAKNSIILTLIVTLMMTLSNLVKTILSTVRVASYNITSGYTYSWEWENLKNIKWIEVIGKDLLIYVGIILAITILFYLGSLIVKKQLSFIKSLSISVTAVIPAVVGALILSPILGLIWSPLSIVFTIIGFVYSLIILYEFMNNELNLEKDKKIYFNLVCFGILIIAGYYVYKKLFISSVTGELGNLMDFFR